MRRIGLLAAVLLVGVSSLPSTASAACVVATRACVIATANTYLDALLSHDGSKIRLAPDARRTENGGVTGDSAAEIRKSVSPPTPDQVNTGIRDKRWFVDGNQATVLYLLDTSTLPPSVLHTTTTHLAERFKVVRGLITHSPAPRQQSGAFRPLWATPTAGGHP